jgi:glycosyltransferase involved in cell wall biosynthesis
MDYLERILSTAPADAVVFREPFTLSQMAAAIKGCTAFIGIDTAVTHIAAALDIPTIVLFGPSMSRYWGPWPNGCGEEAPFAANKGMQRVGNVTIVQKDWECVPCNRETCAISSRDRMECLEATTPEEVLRELQESVSKRGSVPERPCVPTAVSLPRLATGIDKTRLSGGLRPQGMCKQSMPERSLLSVIVPVYNGGATLAEAIGSVTRQRYDNIELIVVDGASVDNTLEVIRANENNIDIWISEPDQGVYDAMNKGAALAHGDWLYFLGSDDVLLDVVHEVMPQLDDPHGIYYGEVRRTSGKKGIGQFSRRQLIRRNIPHQAIFYPRSVFRTYHYDLKYPVAADYHLNLCCSGDTLFRFIHIPAVIALFNDSDGLSSTKNDAAFAADKPRLIREHFGFFSYLELEIRTGLKRFEKNVLRAGYRRLTGQVQTDRKPARGAK